MKVLFVGGTGNISGAVTRLVLSRGIEVVHLNRGNKRSDSQVETLHADIHDPEAVRRELKGRRFDCVVNWVAFIPEDVERDAEVFRGLTDQYVFISSASAYQKPPRTPFVTESTPLHNPYWQYSRNKIACEEACMRLYRESGLPATIVRPSLTYDTVIPAAIGGWSCFTIIDRMRQGKPVVIHGDGTSLWTVTHADDFAKGFLGLLANPYTLGEAFHITSDEVLTWNQIYQAMADAAGAELRCVHIPSKTIAELAPGKADGLLGDKAHSVIFDNTKIKAFVPGFRAEIPFHIGIRQTVQWFEEDPARMRIDAGNNALLDTLVDRFEGYGKAQPVS